MSEEQLILGLTGFYDRPRLVSDSDKEIQSAGGGFVLGIRDSCTNSPECHPWLQTTDTTFSFDLSNDLSSKPEYTFDRIGVTRTQWIGQYAGVFGGEKIEMEKRKGNDDWLWRTNTILGFAGRIPLYETKEKKGIDLTLHAGVDVFGLNGNGRVDGWCGLEGGLSILYHY